MNSSSSGNTTETQTGSSSIYEFVLVGRPSVLVSASVATLNAVYNYTISNRQTVLVYANVYIESVQFYHRAGMAKELTSTNGQMEIQFSLGPLGQGNYYVQFYVLSASSGAPLSRNTTISFTV